MLVRLSAVAAALALLAAGCGGDGPSRRDAVAHYIEELNTIQAEAERPSLAVSQASRRLAKPQADRAAVSRKLRGAARQIDRLRERVAALSPPADARRLRLLVLELMRSEAALAREMAQFATFAPALQDALRPLGPAGAQLKTALAAKSAPAVKAAALEAYAASIAAALRRLRALQPPPVSAPAYRSQLTTLERVRAASAALALALREKRAEDLPKLLRGFEQAALSNQSLAAQRAQIAAVRAYNGRVRSLDDLTVRIYRERARLQKVLD